MNEANEQTQLGSFFIELWKDAKVFDWCVVHHILYGLSLGLTHAGKPNADVDLLATLSGYHWMHELARSMKAHHPDQFREKMGKNRNDTIERIFLTTWGEARHETGDWRACENRLQGMALILKAMSQHELAENAALLARIAAEHERRASVMCQMATRQLRILDGFTDVANQG